jgi:glutamate synthase domain-containing protein 2
MAEEAKDPWLNYLALTTVVLAVCATMATFKGGGFSTRQILSQAKASDEWAYYQAKSVKSSVYELGKDTAELEAKALPANAAKELRESYVRRVAEFSAKMAKYDQEKQQIMDEAKRLEQARDDAQKHGSAFGVAVIFLQISILLSSIAALLKKKPVWALALVVGFAGVVCFLNGFLLFL